MKKRNQKSKNEGTGVELENKDEFQGCIIPHSEIQYGSKLGEGAFGIVYKGMYKKTEGNFYFFSFLSIQIECLKNFFLSFLVAIKKSLAYKMADSELEDFKSEAKLMKYDIFFFQL